MSFSSEIKMSQESVKSVTYLSTLRDRQTTAIVTRSHDGVSYEWVCKGF